jgi:hypothetical protein
VVLGFLFGIAATAAAIRSDVGFQLASGPSLFLAGYIAADRRRVLLTERFTFVFGAAAGVATMILRWYGQGQQAAWQGLLLASALVTVVLRVKAIMRRRAKGASRPATLRTLAVESGEHDPHRLWAPVRSEARQPVLATSPVATAFSRAAGPRPTRAYDNQGDPNELVRQMRSAATRGRPLRGRLQSPLVLLAALLLLNPVGLWLTWNGTSFDRRTKLLLSSVSVLWYLGVAGLVFALTHR